MSFTIILQFIMQTCLLVAVALLFIPIIGQMIFETSLFANTSAETQGRRDVLWTWTIIIFIAAMAGNVVWFFRTLQRQSAGDIEA